MRTPEQLRPETFEYYLDIGLEQQYRESAKILDRLGLLELLPESGEKGIRGIDGKEYPIPSLDSIKAKIKNNREKYQIKFNQGFTQIQLTPFGLPLELLAAKLEETILKHYKDGKLFSTKANPDDPDEPLELDANQPLFTWEKWVDKTKPLGEQGADVSGECVYHPSLFDQTNHGGLTKQQILDNQRHTADPFAGWEVKLLEPSLNIPREGKGEIKGERRQLEAGQTPEQYQKTLQTEKQYQNEQGLTNEDWITQFLIHLEKTNQVIDDFYGKGSACFLTGSFNCVSRYLGSGCWAHGNRRASLGRSDPRGQSPNDGFRSAVGLDKNWYLGIRLIPK